MKMNSQITRFTVEYAFANVFTSWKKMGKYAKFEEKRIEAFEKYPGLWNTKGTKYKNKKVKENA